MVVFELYIPAILAGIALIIWNLINKPKTIGLFIGRLLFTAACLLCFNAFFMPFPLDSRGFHAISDPYLPMREVIYLVPFASLKDDINHLDIYFTGLIPMAAAALALGFSINLAFRKLLSFWKCLLISFSIPFGCSLIHAIIKLTTGEMLKKADVTNVIWFTLAFFIGYVICFGITKLFGPGRKRENA